MHSRIPKKKSDTQIIFEYGGVDLNMLPNRKPIIMDVLRRLIYIVDGLKKLNMHNIIHCDVRLGNIVYNESNKKLALIDFGMALYKQDLFWSKANSWLFQTAKGHAPDYFIVMAFNKSNDIDMNYLQTYKLLKNKFFYDKNNKLLINAKNEKHFKNVFDLYKKAYVKSHLKGVNKIFDECKDKVCIYAFGRMLFDFYNLYSHLLSNDTNEKLVNIIVKTTHFDFRKRLTFEQLLKLFRKYFPF